MEAILTKDELDDVIQYDIDKVVCIRFGVESEADTVFLDETVRSFAAFQVNNDH